MLLCAGKPPLMIHAHRQTRAKIRRERAYITAEYVSNKICDCAMKFFTASQDETAPKINSLAPDNKFAGFSLLLTYEYFWPALPDGALRNFICFLFPGEKNIHSLGSIKDLTFCIAHKTAV